MANESGFAVHQRTTRFSELERKRRSAMPRGAVYFVSYGEGGPIKIGYVEGFAQLPGRLRGLQTGCPHNLILLATKPGSMGDERALHQRFAGKRLRGEWFERHPALMRTIESVRRRKDCQTQIAAHPEYQPAPEGLRYLRVDGRNVWLQADAPE